MSDDNSKMVSSQLDDRKSKISRRQMMVGATGVGATIGVALSNMPEIRAQQAIPLRMETFANKCERTQHLLEGTTVGEMLASNSTTSFARVLERHYGDLDTNDKELIELIINLLDASEQANSRRIRYRDFFVKTENPTDGVNCWEPNDLRRREIKTLCFAAQSRFHFAVPRHLLLPTQLEDPSRRQRSRNILDGWTATDDDGNTFTAQGLVEAMGPTTPYLNLFGGLPNNTTTSNAVWQRHLRDWGLRHEVTGLIVHLEEMAVFEEDLREADTSEDERIYTKDLFPLAVPKGCAIYNPTDGWMCKTHGTLTCDPDTVPVNSSLCPP